VAGSPDSLEQTDRFGIQQGQRVLAHYRGGVGRANLVACWFDFVLTLID